MSGSLMHLKSNNNAVASWVPPPPRFETLRAQLAEVSDEAKREYIKSTKQIDAIKSDAYHKMNRVNDDYTIFLDGAMDRIDAIESTMRRTDDTRRSEMRREIDAHFASAK